ncbi:hypothetical protein [Aminobacter anthyllidis]|uniref:hypothetical protein n=1 Tax=Aminobacter anthyllidis TaxID=1035067 RepID=UPI003CC7CCAC
MPALADAGDDRPAAELAQDRDGLGKWLGERAFERCDKRGDTGLLDGDGAERGGDRRLPVRLFFNDPACMAMR